MFNFNGKNETLSESLLLKKRELQRRSHFDNVHWPCVRAHKHKEKIFLGGFPISQFSVQCYSASEQNAQEEEENYEFDL